MTGGGCGPFVVPGVPGAAPVATQQAVLSQQDPTSWEVWWSFNRDALLELKAAIDVEPIVTGSDDYFLGRGERSFAPAEPPQQRAVRERVVPALLEALEDESSPQARAELILALARIGASHEPDKIESVLVDELEHASLEVVQSAVVGLGILGLPSTARTLEHVLADCPTGRQMLGRNVVPRRTRSFAAYAMGLTALRSKHEDARRYAALYLTSALDAWQSSDDLQVACISALGIDPVAFAGTSIGDAAASSSREAVIQRLLSVLDDPKASWQTRAHAVTALGRLTHEAPEVTRAVVAERLVRAVLPRSKDPEEVRRSAILALGALGTAGLGPTDLSIRKALTTSTTFGPQASRNFSWLALGRVAGRPASGGVAFAATPAVRKELSRSLARAKGTRRAWIALGLGLLERGVGDHGETPAEATRTALVVALQSAGAPTDRAAIGLALGLTGDPKASDVLVEAFRSLSDDGARGNVALGLGLLGVAGDVGEVDEALREAQRRPQLLQECAIALALAGDRSVVEDLVEMLDEAGDVTSRAAIANALGQVGDQRGIEPLVAMLGGASTDRLAAARALGRLCETDRLPWSASLSTDVNYLASTESLASGVGILDLR